MPDLGFGWFSSWQRVRSLASAYCSFVFFLCSLSLFLTALFFNLALLPAFFFEPVELCRVESITFQDVTDIVFQTSNDIWRDERKARADHQKPDNEQHELHHESAAGNPYPCLT